MSDDTTTEIDNPFLPGATLSDLEEEPNPIPPHIEVLEEEPPSLLPAPATAPMPKFEGSPTEQEAPSETPEVSLVSPVVAPPRRSSRDLCLRIPNHALPEYEQVLRKTGFHYGIVILPHNHPSLLELACCDSLKPTELAMILVGEKKNLSEIWLTLKAAGLTL